MNSRRIIEGTSTKISEGIFGRIFWRNFGRISERDCEAVSWAILNIRFSEEIHGRSERILERIIYGIYGGSSEETQRSFSSETFWEMTRENSEFQEFLKQTMQDVLELF